MRGVGWMPGGRWQVMQQRRSELTSAWWGSSGGNGGNGGACTPELALAPAANQMGVLTLSANAPHPLTATVTGCADNLLDTYSVTWFADTNNNGQLDDSERTQPFSEAREIRWISCGDELGSRPIRIEATSPATDPAADGAPLPNITRTLTLEIVGASADTSRDQCVFDSLETVRNINTLDPSDTQTLAELDDAISCFDDHLEQNICDLEAAYGAGLAQFSVFMSKFPERFNDRNNLSVPEVIEIFETEVVPTFDRFIVVDQKADDDFSFFVDGLFELTVFDDIPSLPGDETVRLQLNGEHDLGEVRGIAAAINGIRTAFELSLAYMGVVQFGLDVPDLGEIDFNFFREEGVSRMIEDPEFLTIDGNAGRERIRRAQGTLIDAIDNVRRMVDFIRQEEIVAGDSQRDDLVRYWDCGEDGLCDCQLTENQPCPHDPEDYPGTPDTGEGDGQFTPGEPVGTSRVGFASGFPIITLPGDLDAFVENIVALRENVRGPDALDLDELLGAPVESFLRGLLVPVPEIRLSEWFVTPSDPRDVVPLYSISDRDVIFEIENEPFDDLGYDGIPDAQETVRVADNPLELAVGTAFDPLTNPDPHFDNLNPFCNPSCNFNDGIDNDGDGLADVQDEFVFDTIDVPMDLGVEGNFVFDFVDLNQNFQHDPDEPSEPFDDTGVQNPNGDTIGAGNGRWDFADSEHVFPTGGDIGPVSDLNRVDPPNGTAAPGVPGVSLDRQQRENNTNFESRIISYEGLYDPFYFFFQDPTFSGVLQFPEELVSIDGRTLTPNAKLHRFISKALEFAAVPGLIGLTGERRGDGLPVSARDGNPHPCNQNDAQSCFDSLDALGADVNP